MKEQLVALLTPFLTALGTALAGVVAGYLVKLLAAAAKRIGLQITTEQEERARELARQAVLYAEEWAAKLAKERLAPSADAKYQRAKETLLKSLPGLTSEQLDQLVQSAVAALPGVGATGSSTSPPPLEITVRALNTGAVDDLPSGKVIPIKEHD